MGRTTSIQKALCVAAITFALASAAQASATRTFVSGLGNDSNTSSNCPRTTPCRTLAMALTVTSAGGEILALDPAGYGPITITGALSLIGVEGASIGVATGTVGVNITASGSDVIISDFIISGAGASSTTGIQVNAGLLTLRNSVVKGLTTGLLVGNDSATARADVVNTDIIGNGTGISTNGTGVDIQLGTPFPAGALTIVRIAHGSINNNAVGFSVNNPGTGTGGYNRVPIFLFTESGSGWSTNVTGNATLSTISPSCGDLCDGQIDTYESGNAPN
jgi:hypothetical protein